MSTTTPDLLLQVDNVALTEAINFCDFALKYNADGFIVSDGFIKKQATPELANYYPNEQLNFIIENANTNNEDTSFFKKITIRNVTKACFSNENVPTNILGDIFDLQNCNDWKYLAATDTTKEMLIYTQELSNACENCNIAIKSSVNFHDLQDYYLSYTVQYYYTAVNQNTPQTCVFDPLIKITNGDRR